MEPHSGQNSIVTRRYGGGPRKPIRLALARTDHSPGGVRHSGTVGERPAEPGVVALGIVLDELGDDRLGAPPALDGVEQ